MKARKIIDESFVVNLIKRGILLLDKNGEIWRQYQLKGKEKRPVILHRVVYGAIERFIGIMTEHLNGKFPAWLSPTQVKIITLNDACNDYAKEVFATLVSNGFRVEIDDRSETLGKKVREAQLQKVNYILTIGEKEVEAKSLAVRDRNNENKFGVSIEDFIAQLKEEVEKKELK